MAKDGILQTIVLGNLDEFNRFMARAMFTFVNMTELQSN